MPTLGIGWQCFSLTDISGEKRREALERTFFHDIMNRACAVKSVSDALASETVAPESRSEFMGMLAVSARALVDDIQSHCTLQAAEKGDLAAVEAMDGPVLVLAGVGIAVPVARKASTSVFALPTPDLLSITPQMLAAYFRPVQFGTNAAALVGPFHVGFMPPQPVPDKSSRAEYIVK